MQKFGNLSSKFQLLWLTKWVKDQPAFKGVTVKGGIKRGLKWNKKETSPFKVSKWQNKKSKGLDNLHGQYFFLQPLPHVRAGAAEALYS